ncbi:DinB family protein [Niabella hirudinis]|uniref:DinB family protein n=1 Tax=Niabella hirudinis TaxID=1285929 RepID=UPI003EC1482E
MQKIEDHTAMLFRQFMISANAFVEGLKTVPGADFNRVPFDGSWSPAQVGDHVLKFLNGIKDVLKLPTAEPGRAPDAHEPVLREIFLNFEQKSKAPAFIEPSADPIDKGVLLSTLAATVAALGVKIKKSPLLKLYEGAPFPTIGDLTGMEWVLFGTYHLQRHTHQLEQMRPYFSIL